MKRVPVRAVLLLLCALTAAVRAQRPEASEPALTTLRLYANLAQVPTLVLSNGYGALAPIPGNLFAVSIDGGKPFVPTRVRREGDDPLSLAVLLDVSGTEQAFVRKLAGLVEDWAKASLLPHDRVSVYAFDCAIIRSADGVSGAETGALRRAVEAVLLSATVHGGRDKPSCGTRKHLWDALSVATAKLASAPGRRVVLAVTDGYDGGSSFRLRDVRFRAVANAVTVFAMSEQHQANNALYSSGPASENGLSLLCALTGGVIVQGQTRHEDAELRDFVRMIRDRYVIEFPRPRAMDGPQHTIEVTIRRGTAIVRPAGLSITVETEDEKAVMQRTSEPVDAPEVGTHRILPSPP